MTIRAAAALGRRAAVWLLVGVMTVAALMLLLDGRPAVAAGSCQYQPYGDPCPKVTPVLATAPQPPSAPLGSYLSDRATLSGGDAPAGTLTFTLYRPGDETCGNAVFSWVSGVAGNGDVYSGSFMADQVGTWRWRAVYSGDDRNEAVASGCADELVTVTKASPYAYLYGSGSTTVGSTSWAYFYVYGAYQATGSVRLGVYGPNDPTCSASPVWSQDFPWYGSSSMSNSVYFGPFDALGTWRYRLDYTGDANNNPVSLACGSASVEVSRASPYVWAGASPGALAIGGAVTVNGQVAYGYRPTGTVAVSFFAPSDPGCSSPAATRDVALRTDGTFDTTFTPTSVGVWRITASYPGDGLNNPASTWCGATTVDVSKASPSLFPAASPTTAETGSVLQAFTLVQGGYTPGGRVSFRLYRPDDATCAGLPAYIEEANVVGGAAGTSTGFVVPGEGTWRWQAVYLGDENNNGATSPCDQAPVSVVAKLGTPPRDPGGTPFVTSVYYNCFDDHNIGVPYGSRLVLRTGWATKTEKQLKGFLSGIVTRASVDGVPIGNADRYWSKPFLGTGEAPWTSRWEYDTGKVVTAFTQPFTVEFQVVATKAGTDGFGTWSAGDVLLSPGGPCLVAGYQP